MKKLLYILIAAVSALSTQVNVSQQDMGIGIPTMVKTSASLIAQSSSTHAKMSVLLDFIKHMHDNVLPAVQSMAQNQKNLANDLKLASLSPPEKEVLFSQFNETNRVLKELLNRVTTLPPLVQKMLTEFSQHTQEALEFLQNRTRVRKTIEFIE